MIRISKDYLGSVNEWQSISDYTDGVVSVIKESLIPHQTELSPVAFARQGYVRRQNVLSYFNHCKLVEDIYLSSLGFNLSVDYINDAWGELLEDVTGYGDSLKDFIKQITSGYIRHGLAGILVDAPEVVSNDVLNANLLGERSYWVGLDARQIYYYKYFDNGALKGSLRDIYISLGEYEGGEAKKEKEELIRRYFIIEQGDLFQFEDYTIPADSIKTIKSNKNEDVIIKGTLVNSGVGNLKVIPIVLVGSGIKESSLKDIKYQSYVRLNKKSALDNGLFYTGFQRVAIFGIHADDAISASENTAMVFENANGHIETIPASDMVALSEDISREDKNIFKLAYKQRYQIIEETGNIQSAESKAKDAQALNDFYISILEMLENKLNIVLGVQAEYQGTQDVPILKFIKEFKSEDLEAKNLNIQLAINLADKLGNKEITKEVLKSLVAKLEILPMDNKSEEERKKEILESIDKMEDAVNMVGLEEQEEEEGVKEEEKEEEENKEA